MLWDHFTDMPLPLWRDTNRPIIIILFLSIQYPSPQEEKIPEVKNNLEWLHDGGVLNW